MVFTTNSSNATTTLQSSASLSSGFIRLKGSCPVCRGARKDCRQQPNSDVVHCRSGSGNASGYVSVGFDNIGFQMWAPANSNRQSTDSTSKFERDQAVLEQSRQRYERQQAKLQRSVDTLSVTKRHEQYDKIIGHVGLSAVDRRRLEQERGLSAADVEYWNTHKLAATWHTSFHDESLSPKLPGVIPSKPGYLKGPNALVIPARNAKGQIRGFQVCAHPNAVAAGSPKYFWLSSESYEGGLGPQLKSGEMPIGVYWPKALKDTHTVYASEGLLKPQLAAYKHGVVMLGAAGGRFDTPEQLKGDLSELEAKTVVFCPDGGAVSNPDVIAAYKQSVATLQSLRYKVEFLWWNQLTKEDGDVDEISTEQFNAAKRISWDDFLAVAAEHLDDSPATTTSRGEKPSTKTSRSKFKRTNKATKKAESDAKKAAKRAERVANAAQWTHILENATEITDQYFGDHILRKLERGIQIYSGPTGTGKTTAYKALVEYAKKHGIQVIYTTATVSQAREFANATGLTYRDTFATLEPGDSFVCCNAAVRNDSRNVNWEAILKEESIVLADEFASISQDLISSGDRKQKHRTSWTQLIQNSKAFITGDANLKGEHVELLTALGNKPLKAYVIRHTAKPRNIILWADSNEENAPKNAGDYVCHLLSNELRKGNKAFCVTNAQQGNSTYGTSWLEDWAADLGASTYRADGETGHIIGHEAFYLNENYNERLNNHQLALISPANAIGKDYAPTDLNASFVLDTGNNSVEQDIQFAGRDRGTCDLNVYIGGGLNQLQYGGSIDPVEIFGKITAQFNTQQARSLSAITSDDGKPEKLAKDFDSADPWLRFQCKRIAQDNAALSDKVGNIARYFREIGHTVEFGVVQDTPEFKADRKAMAVSRQKSADNWNASIAESEPLTRDEASLLRDAAKYTVEEDRSLRKRGLVEHNKTEERERYDKETGKVVEIEKPIDHAKWDATLVHQLSKLRDGTKWWLYYMFANEDHMSWAAHAYRKVKTLDGLSTSSLRKMPLQIFPALEDCGFKAFIEKFVVTGCNTTELKSELESELLGSANANKLNTLIHQQHKEHRFNHKTPEMAAILERLNEGTQFEQLCNLIGASSQRAQDGTVKVGQVLTILRQLFSLNSHYTNYMTNGVKGSYILTCDEQIGALNKAFRRTAKAPLQTRIEEHQLNNSFDSLNRAVKYHQRTELFAVWAQQCEMNRHILNNAPHNALDRLVGSSTLFEEEKDNTTSNNVESAKNVDIHDVQPSYEFNGPSHLGFSGGGWQKTKRIFDDLWDWVNEKGQKISAMSAKYFTQIA